MNRDGTYDIKFEDGERKSGVKKSEIKVGKTVARGRDGVGHDDLIVEGSSVKARFMGGSRWFPGKIVRCRRNGTFDIKYNDGSDEKEVQRSMIQKSVVSPKSKSSIRSRESDKWDID